MSKKVRINAQKNAEVFIDNGNNVRVVDSDGNILVVSGNGGTFISLDDTPSSYIGEDGKVPFVDNNSLKFAYIEGLKGSVSCQVGQDDYEVVYPRLLTENNYPFVSLVIPSSGNDLFVQGIYDISSSGFKVKLSDAPDVVGYSINWLAQDVSTTSLVISGNGEDVVEKLIPVASGLSPAQSGADLVAVETNDGFIYDAMEFGISDRSFYNFTIAENYVNGLSPVLDMKFASISGGDYEFTTSVNWFGDGDDSITHSGGSLISTNVNIPSANLIVDSQVTLSYPSIQQISPGDLVCIKIVRTDSEPADLRLVSMKLQWANLI